MKWISLCLVLFLIFPTSGQAQNLLDGPAEASYDSANDRFLIASSQNHCVVAIDSAGNQSYFVADLGFYVFGVLVSGDTVYVAGSGGAVRAYDLTTRDLLWAIILPGGFYCSAMACDSLGFLFVADNKGYDSKVWKIDLSDLSYEVFVPSGLPPFCYQLMIDEPNNRLLVAGANEDTPITAVDLDDSSLTPIVTPPTMSVSSLMMDEDQYVYISSWYGGSVYRYDQTFTNPPLEIASGFNYPTGIGLNPIDNILAVPEMEGDTVSFVSLDDTDVDSWPDIIDNCPDDFNPLQEDLDSDGSGDSCDCCGLPIGNYTGNTDCSTDGKVNLSDITKLIDAVYVSKVPLCCPQSGNTDGSLGGAVNLSDITKVIDHVYVSKQELAECS
jgi:DNA-binding beta-propeller fold protein YncE